MKVRALRRGGFYGGELRRPGAVFTLRDERDFRPGWMVQVSDDTPESRINAQDAIDASTRDRYGTDRDEIGHGHAAAFEGVDDWNPYP